MRSLSVLIFVATLLGSLLGVAADLSDATGLFEPVVEVFDPSTRLNIVGSNTVLGAESGLAAEWQENFEKKKERVTSIPLIGDVARLPEITVEGVGSGKGFEKALKGEVDLLVMSEPMLPARYDELVTAGIEVECAAEIGYDVVAFVTNMDNKVPQVPKRVLNGILSGSITDWSQARRISRPGW